MDEILQELEECGLDAQYQKNRADYWQEQYDKLFAENVELEIKNDKLNKAIKQLVKAFMDLDDCEFKHAKKGELNGNQ